MEKWFLWPCKGKKLRSNVWETTRCPFSELAWFFRVSKRSRCSTKVDEMLRCTSPWPSWPSVHFSVTSYRKRHFVFTFSVTQKQRIQRGCATISRKTLLKTVDGFKSRLRLCLQANGNSYSVADYNTDSNGESQGDSR